MKTQLTTPEGTWTIIYQPNQGHHTMLSVADQAGSALSDRNFLPYLDEAERAIEAADANAEREAQCAVFDVREADNEIGRLAQRY